MQQRPVPLFGLPDAPPGADRLTDAAEKTVTALREQGAVEAWHELDVMIVLELAKAVSESRGIAKSQMFGALLQARSRLPEPVVAVMDAEAVEYEGARALEFWAAHSADTSHEEIATPLD